MTDIDIVARYSYDMNHIFICYAYVNARSFFFFLNHIENLYSIVYSLLLNVYLSIYWLLSLKNRNEFYCGFIRSV